MSTVLAPPSVQLRPARAADIPALAAMFGRAFAHDPGFNYLAGEGGGRPERLALLWEGLLRYGSNHLSDTFAEADLRGAALWIPPGRDQGSILDGLHMLPSVANLTGWRGVPRFISAHNALHRLLAQRVPEPNYYLAVLGVEPGHQGRGIGSALMRPILERCDRDRLPATLETFTERNLPLYERHGFEVVLETTIQGMSIAAWLMRRLPAQARSVPG